MIRPEYILHHEQQFRWLFELHQSGTTPKKLAAKRAFKDHFNTTKEDAHNKVEVWCANFNELAKGLNITLNK